MLLADGTGRELMVCRKVMRSRSPHYVFSLKSEDLWRKREQRSRLYLGKLRATSANDYVLYDNGICEAPEEGEELLVERERYNGAGGEIFLHFSVLLTPNTPQCAFFGDSLEFGQTVLYCCADICIFLFLP